MWQIIMSNELTLFRLSYHAKGHAKMETLGRSEAQILLSTIRDIECAINLESTLITVAADKLILVSNLNLFVENHFTGKNVKQRNDCEKTKKMTVEYINKVQEDDTAVRIEHRRI